MNGTMLMMLAQDSGGDDAGGIIALVAIVLVVVAIGYLVWRHRKKTIAEWQAFAQQRGLQFSGTYPGLQVQGNVNGINVELRQTRHRTVDWNDDGDRSTKDNWTCEVLAQPAVHVGDLSVYKEGFFSKVGKALGGQDVRVGERVFDDAFIVKSSNPTQAIQVLTPNARQALLESQKLARGIMIKGGRVTWKGPGITNVKKAEVILTAVHGVANAIGR